MVAELIAGEHPHPIKPNAIAGCTYCHPQVASVGLTEAKAKEAGYEVKVGRFPFIGNGKAIALGEPEGMIKTVFDAKTGELLGAHMVGAEVTELIQGYVVGRTLETTEEDLMEHRLPAPDAQRDDARSGARRLRPRDPHLRWKGALPPPREGGGLRPRYFGQDESKNRRPNSGGPAFRRGRGDGALSPWAVIGASACAAVEGKRDLPFILVDIPSGGAPDLIRGRGADGLPPPPEAGTSAGDRAAGRVPVVETTDVVRLAVAHAQSICAAIWLRAPEAQ